MNHAETKSKVKNMTSAELEYALKDLNEVLAIQDRAPWADPAKVSAYHDERLYVVEELSRRRAGGWKLVRVRS